VVTARTPSKGSAFAEWTNRRSGSGVRGGRPHETCDEKGVQNVGVDDARKSDMFVLYPAGDLGNQGLLRNHRLRPELGNDVDHVLGIVERQGKTALLPVGTGAPESAQFRMGLVGVA